MVIVRSFEGHDIAEYAVGLLRHRQSGVFGQNNGVLLLISIDDRGRH
jgi:uncharacterized membrane protein YgcG